MSESTVELIGGPHDGGTIEAIDIVAAFVGIVGRTVLIRDCLEGRYRYCSYRMRAEAAKADFVCEKIREQPKL